jgi:hypothetical protein
MNRNNYHNKLLRLRAEMLSSKSQGSSQAQAVTLSSLVHISELLTPLTNIIKYPTIHTFCNIAAVTLT